MKKLVIGLSALALVLSIGTASVFAAGNGTAHDLRTASFVDADGDGVCDNCAGGYRIGAQGRRGRGR